MPKTVLGVTYYDSKDLAELLGVTTNTIRNYYRRGLRHNKWGESNKAYTTAEALHDFLSGRVPDPTAGTEDDPAEQGDE